MKLQSIKRNLLFIIIYCALAVLIIGCGSAQQVSNQAKGNEDLAEVRIPDIYSPLYAYEPYIAEELGIFKEEGIKPVFTGVIPPGQHVAAVVAGTNDVGTLHINRTIAGINGGAKIKAVVAGTESSKQYPHMTYIVLENSPIKTPQDMLGKKVGVVAIGGCHEYTPYEWLKKNGINDPKGKFTFVSVPAGVEEQALRNGDIDVYGAMGIPVDIMSRGGIRVLFDDVDVWGTVAGNTPWYFHEKFIQEKPEVVRRFVKAIARTQDWMNANPDKVAEIMGKRGNVDPKKVSVMHYAEHGVIKEDSIQIWIDLLKNYGELTRDYKPQEIYTNEFNEYTK